MRGEVGECSVHRLLHRLVLVERRAPDEPEQARVHVAALSEETEHLDAPPHQLLVQRLAEDELDDALALDPLDEQLGR